MRVSRDYAGNNVFERLFRFNLSLFGFLVCRVLGNMAYMLFCGLSCLRRDKKRGSMAIRW